MSETRICNRCEGFIPAGRDLCPNCASDALYIPPVLRAAFTVVAGSVMAVTLSACYGMPCAGAGRECGPTEPCSQENPDRDGDGFCEEDDCNDRDNDINPMAVEIPGDRIDQNCDGLDGLHELDEMEQPQMSEQPDTTDAE